MSNRDVTLTLKVRDAEVTKAEASVRRLKAASDDLNKGGTSFGGKKASEDAEQQKRLAAFMGRELPQSAKTAADALSKVDEATAAVAASSRGAAAGLSSIAASSGPLVAILAAVVIAIVAVSVVAVKLSGVFADYALEVGNAAEQNGLAVQTMGALTNEAEAQGRSIGNLDGIVSSFRKTIGEAAAGSDDAKAKLKLLGIDGSKAIYDVDTAFKQAIATVVKTPAGIQQARAAFAAFGAEGYKLLPFFREFNGDVEKIIAKARELGVEIGGPDVQAAREFTRAFDEVKKTVMGVVYTFGREFLPLVRDVFRDFGGWLSENKDDVKSWATWVVEKIKEIIPQVRQELHDLKHVLSFIIDPFDSDGYRARYAAGDRSLTSGVPRVPQWTAPLSTPLANYDSNLNPLMPGLNATADPAALEAARAEAERKMKELLEFTKRDWEAAIRLTKNKADELTGNLQNAFEKLQDQFKATGDVRAFQSGIGSILDQYTRKVRVLDELLTKLENGRASMETMTPNERALAADSQQQRVKDHAEKAADIQRKASEQIRAVEKRDMLNDVREKEKFYDGLLDQRRQFNEEELRIQEDWFNSGQQTERDYLAAMKGLRINSLEFEKWTFDEQIKNIKATIAERGDLEGQLSVKLADLQAKSAAIEAQIKTSTTIPVLTTEEQIRRRINKLITDNDEIVSERRSTAQAAEQEQLLGRIVAMIDKLNDGGVNDGLVIQSELLAKILELRYRELDAVISIAKAQMEMDQSMNISANQIKARVYEHLADQKNLNEAIADGINKTYDTIAGRMDEQIEQAFEWAGVFKSLFTEPLKAFSRNSLTKLTKGLLDSIIPGLGTEFTKTNNPIARPIVDAIGETNDLLRRLVGGSSMPGASIGGFNLGSIFGGFGGGGSMGPGGTPMFNPNGGGGGWGSIFNPIQGQTGSINANGEYVVNGSQGGNWMSNIRNLFSSNPGGMFAPTTNPVTGSTSSLGGYLSGIGGIASAVGSFIPGRAGSTIAMAGQGLQIGAMFGPWGAAIGAGVGALIGFLGFSDPKRKQDKQENMPRLRQGFSDATEKLQQILADLRSLNGDPDALLSQAREVRSQMASGFGIQMLSKKYRKQASSLIAQQLASVDREPDGLMAQIIAAAGIARGAADRSKRILPEFAGGVFIDPRIWHPNGLLPGVFDGRDDIVARLTKGEMVLNPDQQARARRRAGHDVFAGIGIPNYPNASPSAAMASGGIAGRSLSMPAMVVQPNFTLEISGVSMDDKVEAYLTGDNGMRTQINVIKKLKKRGDI